jgi:hypothetical protein
MLDGLLALAVGDIETVNRAQATWRAQERGSLRLVGDDDAVRAYRELLIEFQGKLGQTVRAADRVRYVEVMGKVEDALDEQERRVWRGEELRRLSPAAVAEMANIWGTASRMLAFDQPPSVPARLVRWVIDHLWRTQL